jgi:phospholipase C
MDWRTVETNRRLGVQHSGGPMVRFKVLLLLTAVIGVAGFLASLNGCGGVTHSNTQPPPPGKINHIVIIFQENRTPDNLFHDPVLIDRGADIASSGLNSQNQTIPLTQTPLVTPFDLGHSHRAFLSEWNNGLMNGADQVNVTCPDGDPNCAPANPQYQYVRASDVQPYFTLAETYTFGDRMFQTNQGPSFPAHQYIISGTSAISEKSNFNVSENPTNTNLQTGCIAPPDGTVKILDTTDFNPDTNGTQTIYPCFERPTLTDLLDAKSINWKYYTPIIGSIWTAPNAIQHMCGPDAPPPNGTNCVGAEWNNHVVIGQTQVLTDISAGKLAAVSWVIPTNASSDHAKGNDGSGPSWVASVVNAIGTSQYWKDTAIIITWDDWGGWYDHVSPPAIHNSYEYGLRVPLIVVSPYAKAAYISHVTHDFGSVLKFIEKTFNLPEIDPAVGYADARADDLSDCFDLNQTPSTFKSIPAPLNAQFFLNDKRPPEGPDDD